jgi:large subunit ribosomal protein L19
VEDLIKDLESSFARSDLPRVRPGDTVRVYVKVKEVRINPKTKKPEEKVRLQAYEGVIISERGKGIGKSIVVRKISAGVGVERIFPLVSPSVEKIEIVKRAKVRRANLGYLRGKIGKHAKLKERRLLPEELSGPAAPPETHAEIMAEKPEPDTTGKEQGEG